MKKLCARAVRTNNDSIMVFISNKEKKYSQEEVDLAKILSEEKNKNKILNEKLSRLKGENSVLKNTKAILEEEIERLRNYIIEYEKK